MSKNKWFKMPQLNNKRADKGSALITVIMIVFIMTTLGVAVIAVTLSGFKMSLLFGGTNRAYFIAEAGMEQVAKVLDEQTARVQEQARADAINDVYSSLSRYEDENGNVNYSAVASAIESEYEKKFDTAVNTIFSDIEGNSATRAMLLGLSGWADSANGSVVYKDFDPGPGRIFIDSTAYNPHDSNNPIPNIEVTIRGNANNLNKKLYAKFNLLSKAKTDTLPYSISPEMEVKFPTLPSVFKKAVAAEKNMLVLSGNVTINGDVLSFGTIPTKDHLTEDQDADWSEYGGVMAGMSPTFQSQLGNFEMANSTVSSTSSTSATLKVIGTVATMSNLHTLSSNSSITVQGATYARSICEETETNRTNMILDDCYVMNNLQIDSLNSSVNINKNYYGFVDTGVRIQGNDTYDKDQDYYQYKRTSKINLVSGSNLNLYGEVYVGGTAFFSDFLSTENNHPYSSGVSVMPGSFQLSTPFTYNPNYIYTGQTTTEAAQTVQYRVYENNVFQNNVSMIDKSTTDGANYVSILPPKKATHFKWFWENIWKDNGGQYDINVHDVNINYNNTVSNNVYGYSSGVVIANGNVYEPIQIKSPSDQLKQMSPTEFGLNISDICAAGYHNAVQDFLSSTPGGDGVKLTYIEATKHFKQDYLNCSSCAASVISTMAIAKNQVFNTRNGFVYYGDGDSEIVYDSISNAFYVRPFGSTSYDPENSISNSSFNNNVLNGIIYSEGNIYVDSTNINKGFTLNGTLLSSKNVVFMGSAPITITYDELNIRKILGSDDRLMGLFRLAPVSVSKALNGNPFMTQRIETKNIDIIDWREVI